METMKQSHHIYPKSNGEDEIDGDEEEDVDQDFEDEILSDEDHIEDEEEDEDSLMQKWNVHESERIIASQNISSWTNSFRKQFVLVEETDDREQIVAEYKRLWRPFTDQTLMSQLLYQVDKVLIEEEMMMDEEVNGDGDASQPTPIVTNTTNQYAISDSDSDEEDDGFCMKKVRYDQFGRRIVEE